MTRDNILETLRELVYETPSPTLWKRIVGLLERETDSALHAVAVQYTAHSVTTWPNLLRLAPRRWWEARLKDPDFPEWSLVKGLDLSYGEHKAPTVSTALEQLAPEALAVRNSDLQGKHLSALLRGADLTQLSALDLSHNRLSSLTIINSAIAESDPPNHLKLLRLSNNNLTGTNAFTLNTSSVFDRLDTLDLSQNPLDEAALTALWQSNALHRVQTLVLEETGLDERAATAFSSVSAPSGLRHLKLGGNTLNGGGLWELAESSMLDSLDTLDLSRNGLFWRDVRAFTRMVKGMGLETLVLDGNYLEDEGVRYLIPWKALRDIRALSLADNRISDEGAQEIAKAPWLGGLEKLDLSNNNISDVGTRVLKQALGDRARDVLVLRGNTGFKPIY